MCYKVTFQAITSFCKAFVPDNFTLCVDCMCLQPTIDLSFVIYLYLFIFAFQLFFFFFLHLLSGLFFAKVQKTQPIWYALAKGGTCISDNV